MIDSEACGLHQTTLTGGPGWPGVPGWPGSPLIPLSPMDPRSPFRPWKKEIRHQKLLEAIKEMQSFVATPADDQHLPNVLPNACPEIHLGGRTQGPLSSCGYFCIYRWVVGNFLACFSPHICSFIGKKAEVNDNGDRDKDLLHVSRSQSYLTSRKKNHGHIFSQVLKNVDRIAESISTLLDGSFFPPTGQI